jgi:hypothetical protein
VTATWTPSRQRLVVVPGPGLAGAGRVLVSSRDLAADTPGLLTLASAGGQRLGVELFSRPELPSGVIAVGADLAARHGLDDPGARWELTARPAQVPARLTLEPMTDGDLQETSRALLNAADLAGRVVFADPGESTWLTVGDVPFRLREATGPDGGELTGLLRVGRDTDLMLYARSGRTGTDIVVLADCSGSMSIDDVPPVTGEDPYSWRARQPGRSATMRRSEAQRQALLRLLDSRLSTSGRVSRIALVRFTTESSVVFPAGAGMAEMSADSDPAVPADYRREVGRLLPASSATDIGQALHFASELLHRHGVPGNEQLIVLISDGADWNPKGAEATGEAVAASTDPVSLMDELHQAAGIRLHAIGISDDAAFRSYWSREGKGAPPQPWMVPDHRLLADLVRVGGGDPSRIGGMDVLEKYFGGLGSGVTTRVGVPARPADPPPVQPGLAGQVRRELGIDPARRADFARRAEELCGLYAACLQAAGTSTHLLVLRSPNSGRSLSPVPSSRAGSALHRRCSRTGRADCRRGLPRSPTTSACTGCGWSATTTAHRSRRRTRRAGSPSSCSSCTDCGTCSRICARRPCGPRPPPPRRLRRCPTASGTTPGSRRRSFTFVDERGTPES